MECDAYVDPNVASSLEDHSIAKAHHHISKSVDPLERKHSLPAAIPQHTCHKDGESYCTSWQF
ncbi:hypothetical protein EON65_26495 [archaeon]|nr:MAG: hypothetical protein EON65_26495 [archaeon]